MTIEKCINEYDVADVIFEEGSTGRELYVVLDGKIDIVKTTGATKTTIVTLGKGEFFGEMALIDDAPRSATVVALRDGRGTATHLVSVERDISEELRLREANLHTGTVQLMCAPQLLLGLRIPAGLEIGARSRILHVLLNNAASKSSNFFEPFETFPLEDWNEV